MVAFGKLSQENIKVAVGICKSLAANKGAIATTGADLYKNKIRLLF